MKSNIRITLFLLIGLTFLSCDQTSPRKYVEVTVLNTNRAAGMYRIQYINEIRTLKKKGRLTVFKGDQPKNGTAVAYVKQRIILTNDASLEKVKVLKVTDETEDLIIASLDFFEYSKKIFESDYLEIARMLDENKPDTEIDAAVENMYRTHDWEMEKRLNRLDELAVSYAKKHNVPLEMM